MFCSVTMKVNSFRNMLLLLFGFSVGIGGFTFFYAKGYSYMLDDSETCANCHIMQEQLSGWMKGSHRNAAKCNDCHTPAGLVPKYFTKAVNGFNHSYAFTSGHYPVPIVITERSRSITEKACLKCHESVFHANAEMLSENCIKCHSSVGHK